MVNGAAVAAVGLFLAQLAAVRTEGGWPDPESASRPHNVRCLTPVAEELVRHGLENSPTFQRLIRDLAATDVVVLVVTGRWGPEEGGGHANVRLVASGGTPRLLRVWVDPWWRTRREQVARLAHELQHAIEIGRAPWVRTSDELGRFYGDMGRELRARQFETRDAERVGVVVERELGAPRARERRSRPPPLTARR